MMALKDEPWRRSLAAYPRQLTLRATFGDLDSFQHVNNVALARYFEEGRAELNMSIFGVDAVVRPSGGVQLLFASVRIDYLAQVEYPGELLVATGVSRIGKSSFNQAAAIFQAYACVALCEAVTVLACDGRGAPVPPDILLALRGVSVQR